MTVTIGPPDGHDVLDTLGDLSNLVLVARHEEDFLERLAHVLREHVQCDAVILRLLERHIQTRAVATENGVYMLPPDELWAPFRQEDRELWIARSAGIYCHDIDSAEHLRPQFREHALDLGLNSGLMVPIIRDGNIHGKIIFLWSARVTLTESQTEQLRKLTNYAGVQFTLFNMRKANELDGMTGLLNRLGLRRRWEVTLTRPRGIVFFIEVTGLKSVADARGHLAAEDLLRQTARMLLDVSSPQVAVGRYSDNQFVLLAPGMSSSRADALRKAFDSQFNELVATLPPPHPRCGVSVAKWPHDGTDLSRVLTKADRRLNEQKQRRLKLTMTTAGNLRQGRMPRTFIDGWLVTSPDGVLVTDADRKVIYVNRAYEHMTGYSSQQWLGKTPGFIASGKTPPAVYEEMWSQLRTVGAWMGKVVNRHRLGHEWISFMSVTKIHDRSGRLAGFLGLARDVTRVITDGSADGFSDGLTLGVTDGRADEDPLAPAALQQSFTEAALAFALAKAGQMHEGGTAVDLERIRDFTHLLVVSAAERDQPDLQSYEYRSAITLASILHDIGNLTVPHELLRKPGELSETEFSLIKTHADAGRGLLQSPYLRGSRSALPSLFIKTAANIAGSHHERWDGTGYPHGLAGRAIPLEARIVAIADVYDALRSRRPYKAGWSHADAVAYIEDQSGAHFDPALVEVFTSVRDEFNDVWTRSSEHVSSGQDASPRRASDSV